MKIDMIVSTQGRNEEYSEISEAFPFISVDRQLSFSGTRVRDKVHDFFQIPVREVKTVSIFITHDDDVHPQV